jgi:hypothetical protein
MLAREINVWLGKLPAGRKALDKVRLSNSLLGSHGIIANWTSSLLEGGDAGIAEATVSQRPVGYIYRHSSSNFSPSTVSFTTFR